MAYNNEDFYHAIKWFSEALRLDVDETIKTTARHVVLDYLSYSVFVVDYSDASDYRIRIHIHSETSPRFTPQIK